jgi:membrane-associated two-gene conflict system component 1 (EACC1)
MVSVTAFSHEPLGDDMGIVIETLDDDSGDQLSNLRQWLRDDEELRSVYIVEVSAPAAPHEMTGGAVAALEAAVVNKELLVALTSALGGWLASRASTRRTRIRVRRGGREIEIDTAKVRDSDEIARQIWQDLKEGD